ncbi:MAG: MFS transporter [Thermoleophilia bacterium]|nr:MFS transporter [Thermoleophilia bacterium]
MSSSDTSRYVDSPRRTEWFQLGIICAAGFVVWSGFGAILPYFPVFLQEQAHASVWLIGVVAAAYYVGTFVFAAPLGRLSDSVGRKPLIVSGVALYALASGLFVSTTNPWWFIFFRLLEGVGAAAVTPAGSALIADLSTEETRSRAYGWYTTAQFGGLVAGPVLAVPLYKLGGGSGTWAFYTIFLFGCALSAVMALMLLFTIREPEHARLRRQTKVHHPPYRQLVTRPVAAFLVVAFTGNFAMGVWEVIWSLYLRHLGASMAFISFTWVAFSVPMLLSFVGGYLADRYNRWALMFSGYVVSGIAWILYGTVHNLTLFLVISVVEGFAVAWSYPAKQAFLVQVVSPRWLGSVQGLESSSVQIAGLTGTLVAPLLYGYVSGYIISLAGVVTLAGLAFAGPVLFKVWNGLKDGGVKGGPPAGLDATPVATPVAEPAAVPVDIGD